MSQDFLLQAHYSLPSFRTRFSRVETGGITSSRYTRGIAIAKSGCSTTQEAPNSSCKASSLSSAIVATIVIAREISPGDNSATVRDDNTTT